MHSFEGGERVTHSVTPQRGAEVLGIKQRGLGGGVWPQSRRLVGDVVVESCAMKTGGLVLDC